MQDTQQELKQQAHKEFALTIGVTSIGETDDEEYQKRVESFLDSLIDRTVQKTEERILKKLKNKQKTLKKEIKKYKTLPFRRESGEVRGELVMVSGIISLITNKSDINK